MLEAGRRYRDEDFAETTWNARRYYWLPRLGLRGIFRMTLFKDVFVVSGCGVGGGSLGYANTLYRPTPGSAFYRDPQWAELEDWESALAPHYDTAEQMLGVTQYEGEGPADRMLREIASEMGVEDTYSTTRVGVYFGEPGQHRARSLLRRRGAAARGLHPLRRLHGRLPPQREEHAGQELPLVRRARRRRDPARAHRRRHPPARRRPTAPTATRSRASAPARGCARTAAR